MAMKSVAPANIDAYIAMQTEEAIGVMVELRQLVKRLVPDAVEVISYQMPAFKYHGMLVYFAAFKNHYALYPGNKEVIKMFSKELKDFDQSAGTIRFSYDKPMPVALIEQIVKERVRQNLEKRPAK